MDGIAGTWTSGTDSSPPGRQWGLLSLAMVMVNLPWVLVANVAGHVAMALLGVPEGLILVQAGAAGWVVWTLMVVLMAVPSVIGLVLGAIAWRGGSRGLAVTGLVANAIVALLVVGVAVGQVVAP